MRTTRKRAIERARHLTRMGTIEVGDIVEVVYNSMSGFEKGSIVYAAYKDSVGDWLLSRKKGDYNQNSYNTLWHSGTDIKLIEKGSN